MRSTLSGTPKKSTIDNGLSIKGMAAVVQYRRPTVGKRRHAR